MRGRLKQRLSAWRAVVTSTLVISWIALGVQLEWSAAAGPPAPKEKRNHKSALEHAGFLTTEIVRLEQSQVIMRREKRPAVVSPLGVVEQEGKLRMILDLRYVNKHLEHHKFKYETVAQLGDVLLPGDYIFCLDLKGGYHHVDMHEDAWEYLGFAWDNQCYVFTQMPFGLAPACWVFTKLMRELLKHWRRLGRRITNYIDDFCGGAADKDSSFEFQEDCKRDFADLNLLLSGGAKDQTAASPAEAVQLRKYLGFHADTAKGCLMATERKREKTFAALEPLLQRQPCRATVRELMELAGRLQDQRPAFGPLVSLKTFHMYKLIAEGQGPDPYRPKLDRWVLVTPEARAEMAWWADHFDQYNGSAPLWRGSKPGFVIHSDAAGTSDSGRGTLGGWGAWMVDRDGSVLRAAGKWTPPESLAPHAHSTWLEVNAAGLRALPAFNRDGRMDGRTVLLVVDNSAARYLIEKMGSTKPELQELLEKIFWYCFERGITLRAEWVPREENELADALSKIVDKNDWMLHEEEFGRLARRFGPFEVDLFASHTTRQLPKYFSLYHTPDTAGIDAFAQHWGRGCWCNPPFTLIGRVLRHARECGARMCLLAPAWPSAAWWHQLVLPGGTHFRPFVRECVVLPKRRDLFVPGAAGGTAPSGRAHWTVMALLVDFGQEAAAGWVAVPLTSAPLARRR
jgi:hypothetical protein